TAVGSTLYFTAYDPLHGRKLWKSDGTEAGTVVVNENLAEMEGWDPGWLTAVGSTVYFTASDPTHGYELWRSDGTAAGTYRLTDLSPGPTSSYPSSLTALGSYLFFHANDRAHGDELWERTPSGIQDLMLVGSAETEIDTQDQSFTW